MLYSKPFARQFITPSKHFSTDSQQKSSLSGHYEENSSEIEGFETAVCTIFVILNGELLCLLILIYICCIGCCLFMDFSNQNTCRSEEGSKNEVGTSLKSKSSNNLDQSVVFSTSKNINIFWHPYRECGNDKTEKGKKVIKSSENVDVWKKDNSDKIPSLHCQESDSHEDGEEEADAEAEETMSVDSLLTKISENEEIGSKEDCPPDLSGFVLTQMITAMSISENEEISSKEDCPPDLSAFVPTQMITAMSISENEEIGSKEDHPPDLSGFVSKKYEEAPCVNVLDELTLGLDKIKKECYKQGRDYIVRRKLGAGAFGKCYLIEDLNGKLLAVKVIPLKKHNPREVEVMLELRNSPYILKILGCVRYDDHVRIILPFSHGTLQSFLNGKQSTGAEALSFDFNTIKNILKGILSGLAFMHGKGYIHRDIKGDNVLMFSEHGGLHRAVLADFGMAISIADLHLSSSKKIYGTLRYASPEAARSEMVNYASDIWSAGCVLCEMDTGDPPWKNQADKGLAIIFQLGNMKSGCLTPENGYFELKYLYPLMLQADTTARKTSREIIDILDREE